MGMAPESVFALAILFKFLVLVLLLQQSKRLINFDTRRYFRMFLVRVIPLLAFGGIVSLVYLTFVGNDTFLKFIGFSLAFEAVTLPFIWKAGLTVAEQQFVKNIVKERLHLK
jgi:hypothetical protein